MATKSKREKRREARRSQELQSLQRKSARTGIPVEQLRKPKHQAKNKWSA